MRQIYAAEGLSYVGATFLNCLAIGKTMFPEGNGNSGDFAYEEVFRGGSSTDTQYQLKEDSPALRAGTGGVDVGMFGGSSPYVISGLPALPRITDLRVPTIVPDSTGLVFEVDVEALD